MNKKIICFFAVIILYAASFIGVNVFASNGKTELLRNPFLLLEEQKKGAGTTGQQAENAQAEIQARLSALQVSGIFISGATKMAVINGEIVKEGDSLGDVKVVSIMPEKVTVDVLGGVGYLMLPAIQEHNKGE